MEMPSGISSVEPIRQGLQGGVRFRVRVGSGLGLGLRIASKVAPSCQKPLNEFHDW